MRSLTILLIVLVSTSLSFISCVENTSSFSISSSFSASSDSSTTTAAADDDIGYIFLAGYTSVSLTFTLNLTTGAVAPLSTSSTGTNASWFTWHPTNANWAYAVQELTPVGGVAWLERVSTSLNQYNITSSSSILSSNGGSPCHVNIHPDGKWLLVANYNDGYTAVYPLSSTGKIGEATTVRQDGSNAHMMALHAIESKLYVYTPFLGSDYVAHYLFNANSGQLSLVNLMKTHAGCGPRHFVVHPNSLVGYLICETSSEINTVTINRSTGGLTLVQTLSTIPATFNASLNTGAEVFISPDGQFLFCSNRGHNSLAVFKIELKSNYILTPVGWETADGDIATPRSFHIHPSGKWVVVANQNGNSFTVLKLLPNGILQRVSTTSISFGPAFVSFLP